MTITSAMIFAAGFGTRMGQLTAQTPKPLLPLAGRPMIDHSVELLRQAGIETIVANTHYLPDVLEDHLDKLGVTTFRENPILETGGGLRAALPALGSGPVITMNPDAAWSGANPVQELLAQWKPEMRALLLVCKGDTATSDFDLAEGRISRTGPYRYTGLQIIRTDRLVEIQEQVFSLNRYWDLLLQDGNIHGAEYSGTWSDIGTREKLDQMNRQLQS
jgi:MurNAc alpha-1-phosphate uridylyltransferase